MSQGRLNVTPSTSTGQTPWLVKHSSGEEAIIPVSLVMEDLPEGVNVEQSVRGLRERQARLFKKVSEATGKSLRRQKQYYDMTGMWGAQSWRPVIWSGMTITSGIRLLIKASSWPI